MAVVQNRETFRMWIRKLGRPLVIAAAVFTFVAGVGAGVARAQTDPAIDTIDALDTALLDTMKTADDLGLKGRYHKLEPVVQKTFNLPVMARYAVGNKWNEFNDTERQGLIDAFTRLTVASYAHNFDG